MPNDYVLKEGVNIYDAIFTVMDEAKGILNREADNLAGVIEKRGGVTFLITAAIMKDCKCEISVVGGFAGIKEHRLLDVEPMEGK